MSRFRVIYSASLALVTLSACSVVARSSLPTTVAPLNGFVARPEAMIKYKQLHSFGKGTDGANPSARLVNVDGTFYGTTTSGGAYGKGTVFSITATGTEHVLHSFGKSADGNGPLGGLTLLNGILFGTTIAGGRYHNHAASGCGTVFTITTAGKEKVIYNFGKGTDAQGPYAGLIAVNGTLYGTTGFGGTYTWGTVYSITSAGKEHVLHSFGGSGDARSPLAPLVSFNGALYGTAEFGRITYPGAGAVFSVTPKGVEKIIHNFGGAPNDAAGPFSGLTEVKGKLYGTTAYGGSYAAGAIYTVTATGKERVLYSFHFGNNDGRNPYAGLSPVNGVLYGTTMCGGSASVDCRGSFRAAPGGTIFSITTKGKETVLYSFGHKPTDGAVPEAELMLVKSTLYGTTHYGGAYGKSGQGPGSVFALTL